MTHALTKNMRRFLKCQSVCCKDSTLGTYKNALKHFAVFLQKQNLTIKKTGTSDLADFLCVINEQKLAPYSKLNRFLIVRKYLDWEVETNSINVEILSAFDRSKLPKVPEYLPRPLGSENDREFVNRCQKSNSPYSLMFLILRQTGLRISELINLPFDPVITQNDAAYLKVPLGKMNTERLVPLSNETLGLIKKIQDAYPIRPYGCSKARLIGLVGPISTARNNLANHFKKITAGMTDQNKSITFHRLRHTYATTLLSAGVSIVSIMKLLGHRRIEMSLRYAKITPAHLRDEYLKAIAVIANQAGIEPSNETKTKSRAYHPSEIIELLRSFTNKAAKLDVKNKKNILRKMMRLKTEMTEISFDQLFQISH